MDEGVTGLLDRRDELRGVFDPNAPESSGLQKELEKHLEEVERKAKEKPEKPELPQIIVREQEDWGEFGWSHEAKNKVRARLKEVLGFDESTVENTLEMILAEGNSPEKALEVIEQGKYDERKDAYAQQFREKDLPESEVEDSSNMNAKHRLLRDLNIRSQYIERFILQDEFREENRKVFDQVLPEDLYDMAWNIGFSNEKDFGINGAFPMLRMQVEKVTGEDGKETVKGRYIVNQANFMRWIRYKINELYDQDPDGVPNYFQQLELKKGQFSSVPLMTMLSDHERYFRDETGVKFGDLWVQSLMEPWMLQTIREYDVEYKNNMGDEGKLAETLNKIYFFNKLTKKVLDKSMLYYMSTLSADFDGKDGDSKMGEAWNKILLAYYNLADFTELQGVLGKDADFFKRDGMMDAIKKVYTKKYNKTGLPQLGTFLGDKAKTFEKAFKDKKTGEIKNEIQDKKAFVSFINFFTSVNPDHDATDVVRTALRATISDLMVSRQGNEKSATTIKDDLALGDGTLKDDHTTGVAELMAFSWLRFSGIGAKNDTGAAAYDAQSKWLNSEMYRRKMATEGRGGAFGNPYTVPMFKGMMVDLLRGTQVANAYTTDANGEQRRMSPLEVMEHMRGISAKYEELKRPKQERLHVEGLSKEEKNRLKKELHELDDSEKMDFKLVAGQLEFTEKTLAHYAQNHVSRAKNVYEQVMTAQQIDFEKFTKFDGAFSGISFDRGEFHKQVQEGFLKPLRYLFSTYDELNYNMEVRAPVWLGRENDKDKWEFRTMPLGEALFGYEMLNVKEFRKEKPGGGFAKENGRYVIDYDKVQNDKTRLWKQWAMMKLGADLWSHISRHSTDHRRGLAYYMDVLEAMETIPGEVWGDDSKMRDVRVTAPFFSHEQMKWLKKVSATTNLKLYVRAVLNDLFTSKHRKESMLGESVNIIIGAIAKGY